MDDPNETFREMKEAYARQDWQTMFDRADALWDWVENGERYPKALASSNNPELIIYSYRNIARQYLRDANNAK